MGKLAPEADCACAQLGMIGQRACQREVQRGALAGQQVAIDGLAHERVPERIAAALAPHHQHLLGQRLSQGRRERGIGDRADRGEQAFVDGPPGGRHQREQSPCGFGQALDSHEQQVAERHGQLRVTARGEQLLGVERVSLRALEQPRDEVRARPLPEDALDLLGQLFGGERRELHSAHPAHTRELGDEATHRVLSRKLVETKRGDRQDALPPCRSD